MDLNELLYQHQLALINARASQPGETREAYSRIVAHYAARLHAYRSRSDIQQYSETVVEDELSSPLPHYAVHPDEAGLSLEEVEMISLAAARHDGTTEERKVLALEMIADQLLLIHADLLAIDAHSQQKITEPIGSPDNGPTQDVDGWENEGGHLDVPAAGLPHGVTKKTVSVYSVGPYEYSDLSSALAEAARQRLH
jgi:hypothetical protein